ncbi:MAG TPA: amidohydrolase family protein [Vicinamibacteria bacterium]|nr:amidohydrolase family protein [Vicinamibacteria bacterium]
MRPIIRSLVLCACGALAAGARPADTTEDVHDLVIRGGRVMDPESRTDAIRDVAVDGGRIAAVSEGPLAGHRVIDARGLVVAPGFIDLHAHGQDAENYALRAADGVTTALELEVGTGDVDRFYADREGRALVNYGVSIGHIPVRMSVMGDPPAWLPSSSSQAAIVAASDEQQGAITAAVRKGLERGALAVGMGIQYTSAASRAEILEVFRAAAAAGAPVHVHMRYNGTREPLSSTTALQEVLADAALTGAPLHVVHLHSTSVGFTERHLRMIDEARARRIDVTTECYPYTAGMTDIASGVFDEGWRESLGIDYGDLLWAATGERLTAETFAARRRTGGNVAIFSIPETAVRAALAHPLVMVASDAVMTKGRGHPRSAGTNARLLGVYVREQQALPLMEAIRKVTLLPAQRLEQRAPAFRAKGRVSVGADADLTLFDPERVEDRATWASPALPPDGIPYVLVGGVPVVSKGRIVPGTLPGQGVRAPMR